MEETKVVPNNVTEYSQDTIDDSQQDEVSQPDPIKMQKFQQALNATDKQEEAPKPITWREIKALKKCRYFDIKDAYEQAYVIRNKRTKQIVEIQAATAIQACKIIGWKPKNTKVLDVVNVKEREAERVKVIDKVNIETNSESNG